MLDFNDYLRLTEEQTKQLEAYLKAEFDKYIESYKEFDR